MTRNTKLRSVVLTAVIVLSMIAGAVGGVGTVTAANSATTDARNVVGPGDPLTVYLGEENLELRNSEDIDDGDYAVGDQLTLIGNAGDADGSTATVDSGNADITPSNGFQTGAYYIDDDSGTGSDVDLSVREPSVSDVTLYEGSGTGGFDITGSSIAAGDHFTVDGEFNFGQAAPAKVVIQDDTGDDVTDSALVSSDAWLVKSGGTAEFDTAGLSTGDYTVTVNGSSDYSGNSATDFGDASMSASITVRSDEVTLSLNRDKVTKGAIVTGTVTGIPGDYAVVRVPTTNLLDSLDLSSIADGSGSDLFRATSDRTSIGIDDGQSYIAAEYELGDDGQARFQIDTQYLSEGTATGIEVVGYDGSGHLGDGSGFTDSSEDDATLNIRSSDASVSVDTQQIRQSGTISGTVSGLPDDYAVVRVSSSSLLSSVDLGSVTDGSGDDLFLETSDRVAIGSGNGYAAAEYDLGADGAATFEISGSRFPKGSTVTVEAVAFETTGTIADRTALSASSEDTATFDICSERESCPLGDAESKGIALADLNGDGHVDAFVANHGANAVWYNDGDGTFSKSDQSLGDATSNSVALADLDGDGDVDAFVGNDGANVLWENDGEGRFSKAEQDGLLGALGVAAADVNGDGLSDVVLARSSPNDVQLSDASLSSSSSGGSDASGLDDHWRSDEEQKQSQPGTAAGPTTSSSEESATEEPRETDAPTATSSPTEVEAGTPPVTASSTPSETRTPTPTQAPGLGPIVAVLALLTVALVRRRR
jgi:hypothetical protein